MHADIQLFCCSEAFGRWISCLRQFSQVLLMFKLSSLAVRQIFGSMRMVTSMHAYGPKHRNPNWNPNCYFDCNGDVDAPDLFDLSKNYGKTVWGT